MGTCNLTRAGPVITDRNRCPKTQLVALSEKLVQAPMDLPHCRKETRTWTPDDGAMDRRKMRDTAYDALLQDGGETVADVSACFNLYENGSWGAELSAGLCTEQDVEVDRKYKLLLEDNGVVLDVVVTDWGVYGRNLPNIIIDTDGIGPVPRFLIDDFSLADRCDNTGKEA